jgi:hypothetical protein
MKFSDLNFPDLEYNVTRKFTLRYLNLIIYGGGIIWTILITILNVAAVGYDVVPLYSTSFDNITPLWYERLFGSKGLFPSSWSCNPTVIALNEGVPLSRSSDKQSFIQLWAFPCIISITLSMSDPTPPSRWKAYFMGTTLFKTAVS